MTKAFNKIIFIILLPILLTGCWDYRDINKRSIVLSIGIDKVNDDIELTGEIAKLPTGGGRAKITEVYKYRSTGKDFEDLRLHRDAKIPAPGFSAAERAIVVSEKYARTEGIESYINRRYYTPEFRNSALVVVSKEPTIEFFNGKVKNDIAIGYAVENTIKTLNDNGETLYKTVQEIKADIEFKDIGYLLPYVTKNNETIEYIGLAAMKDSKLAGTIRREDCNGFIFILLKKPAAIMVVQHSEDKSILVSIKSLLKQRKIKTDFKNNRVNIYIDLSINSQLQYLYEYKSVSKNDVKNLEEMISDEIRKDVLSALELSKGKFKCDVFGFARYFKGDNPEEYRKIKWDEEYPYVNFYVNVSTTITNTNLLDVKDKKPIK